MSERSLVAVERIASAIHTIRGHRVMLDADLAALYRVPTGRLNEQVKRNLGRFPEDFMFVLTADEAANLKSQFAISSRGWGGRRVSPRVFTEHGALMLAAVLNSPVAVETSIQIMRAFVQLRQLLESNAELARKLDALEKRHDSQFRVVFQAIRELMEPPAKVTKRIGFEASAQAGRNHSNRSTR
jgi:hypothetical protein